MMPRMNKHVRLQKWIKEVLCDEIMTTSQIKDAIANKSYTSNGYIKSKIKQVPSIQRLTQVLRVNKEFVRVNGEGTYPAKWRLENV